MTMPMASTSYATPADRATAARRGLAIYFAVLIPGSGLVEWLILGKGQSIGSYPWLVLILMYMPTLSSVVARIVQREGIADVSFRIGGRETGRAALTALAMPLVVGFAAYGAAWALGLVGYQTPMQSRFHFVPAGFWPYIGITLVLVTPIAMVSAAGEEIGWRGYMLTRLIDAGVPRPLVVSGLIWATWHFPLILSGQYASSPYPILSAAIFMADVVGIALVIGIVRLRSGSVWPAVLLHGAWNAIIQGPFDRSTTGSHAWLWVGESGLFVAAVSLAFGVAVVLLDRRRPTARAG